VGGSASTQAVGPSQVELRLAGEFGVARGGTELPEGQIGSRKSRTLLKLLAVERPTLVPVDRIVEVLWDAKPPAAAEQNVATLVSRLRAVLGAGVIQGGRQGYRLAVGRGVGVDLDAAAGYCDHAERTVRTAAAVALAAAERALGLLSAGTALAEEPYAAWADPAREELRRLLRRGRLIAAEAALGTGGRGPVGASPGAARAGPDGAGRAVAAVPGADGTAVLGIGSTATGLPGLGRIAASGPALAGRDTEIGALRVAWHAATGGEPGLVMIVGEAGIGKTALAELVGAEAEADGATVLRTRCYETERSLFLQPVIEAIMLVVTRTPAAVLAAARHVRQALKPDGTWMVVEPYAADEPAGNMNPVGRVYYNASTVLCVPNALSQTGGYALGAQAGEAAIRQVVTDAGFTRFRRAAETPFNLVYEVRP
jgi:AAA ATPase domain